ncbi:VTT domain-containing protein [Pelagibius sp. CAU 1746]|uniref:TVP38/TMEM64 family protein n=1 Tax=Pelagibius sp. CAU 1746 TaxID=3140370 RepID=UPI00325BE3AA
MSNSNRTETMPGGGSRGRSALRRLLPLAVLAAAFAVALGFQEHFSIEVLREHRGLLNAFVADNAAAAALAFMTLYAATTLLSLPVGAVLTVAGGFLFGVALGTLYVVVGATLGATALFIVARSTLGGLLRAKAGPFLQRMEAGFRENALSYMLVLRLIPLFPFFIVNLVPAFLGVSLRIYVVGTFIGIIPGTLVFILAGAGLGSVFDQGGAFTVENVLTPQIIAGLVGLSLLSLLPVVYKHVKARRSAA